VLSRSDLSDNWTQFNDDMTVKQSCELGGEERLVGYIAIKLNSKFPELFRPSELEARTPPRWTQLISNGGLHIPFYNFLNLARRWNLYFIKFHNSSRKWKINNWSNNGNTIKPNPY
jgi:hypothetical protein